jgi:hypothetical protein
MARLLAGALGGEKSRKNPLWRKDMAGALDNLAHRCHFVE